MKPLLAILLSILLIPLALAAKPNVVLVITDDQGYGDIACHGNPVIKTPALDALAAESSALDDYHVAPTCSPTRSALVTMGSSRSRSRSRACAIRKSSRPRQRSVP